MIGINTGLLLSTLLTTLLILKSVVFIIITLQLNEQGWSKKNSLTNQNINWKETELLSAGFWKVINQLMESITIHCTWSIFYVLIGLFFKLPSSSSLTVKIATKSKSVHFRNKRLHFEPCLENDINWRDSSFICSHTLT